MTPLTESYTVWNIQYEHPLEGWISYATASNEAATKAALEELRELSNTKWRAIRTETKTTIEDW